MIVAVTEWRYYEVAATCDQHGRYPVYLYAPGVIGALVAKSRTREGAADEARRWAWADGWRMVEEGDAG